MTLDPVLCERIIFSVVIASTWEICSSINIYTNTLSASAISVKIIFYYSRFQWPSS